MSAASGSGRGTSAKCHILALWHSRSKWHLALWHSRSEWHLALWHSRSEWRLALWHSSTKDATLFVPVLIASFERGGIDHIRKAVAVAVFQVFQVQAVGMPYIGEGKGNDAVAKDV